jgi:hypothetical protein
MWVGSPPSLLRTFGDELVEALTSLRRPALGPDRLENRVLGSSIRKRDQKGEKVQGVSAAPPLDDDAVVLDPQPAEAVDGPLGPLGRSRDNVLQSAWLRDGCGRRFLVALRPRRFQHPH